MTTVEECKALLESKGWTAEVIPCFRPDKDAWVVRMQWDAVTMFAKGTANLKPGRRR
jgi:glucuronate isomerase